MQILREPSESKLERFLNKEPLADATILHWTGTMWGIGCRASSLAGIARIQKLKQRPEGLGFIALIPDASVLDAQQIPPGLKPLMQQYWPGNLSIVFRYHDEALKAISVNGKVSFRVPSDPMLRAFIAELGEPLISTSINVSGLVPEEDYERIEKFFGSWFDFALLPPKRETQRTKEHSTIIEYLKVGEAGFTGHKDELKCLREGSVPFYEVKQSFKMPVVMFVCTANICRSPIAEKLFRKMVNEAGLAIAADSSGLMEGGSQISMNSLQLLLEQGITEAQEHVSKQISPQMISGSWLILTMEERQRDILRGRYPENARKILTLNEIVGESGDIADPIGNNLDYYRGTYEMIENRLQRLMEQIKTGKTKL